MDACNRAACAFVTGTSGFLGGYVVAELLATGFERVVVLVRGESVDDATARLRSLWWERPNLLSALGGRVRVVCGDVCEERLGLSPGEYERLVCEVTHIVHAAAVVGVNETAERFAQVNVDGTTNMLLFAGEVMRAGTLRRFLHVSTAYVAGTRTGTVLEDELVETSFNSLYEQSKFGAERVVRDAAAFMPTTIVRPTQIVGDTKTGFVATFNTLYYPLKCYLKGELLDRDWETLARAVDLTYEIFEATGVRREDTFYGTLNAGHPGGCLPLTQAEAQTLHHSVLPDNLYVADSSLFPRSMGNPPMLTIMALAKRVARMAG